MNFVMTAVNFKKRIIAIICLFASVGILPVQATVISLEGTSPEVEVNNWIDIQVWVRDLNTDIISGFDIDITFDDSVLTFDESSFGTLLGDNINSFQSTVLTGNTINVAEVSLLFDSELQLLQASSDFMLASLRFWGTAVGLGGASITMTDVVGENFTSLQVDIGQFFSITVIPDPSRQVPEPSSWTLGLIALLLMILHTKKTKTNQSGDRL
jgi:hypothetical protein